mmetsp:Transcript_17959/g.56317  ORF Transcript_17959/g.56317 Transcript_17959/m.56317 type:complete len:289 (+) Transcript_17959:33-899(+)
MQFTAAQLSGGSRYGPKTRVGNWLEDMELEEEKRAQFSASQAEGKLVMSQMSEKASLYTRPVALSPCEGGRVRFGSVVMVSHRSTATTLAVDLTESILESDVESRLVTASPRCEAVARSAFTIVPVEEGVEAGAELHFGEPFYLASHASLSERPYYLTSALKSCFNASRVANQQPVSMAAHKRPNAVWTCEKIADNAGVVRRLSKREAVPLGEPVVVQHKNTKQALAADSKYADLTDFGRELEVTCHNHFGKEKLEALCSEMAGRATAATTARLEKPPNFWCFQAGSP